jgi:hypothetical protein
MNIFVFFTLVERPFWLLKFFKNLQDSLLERISDNLAFCDDVIIALSYRYFVYVT